MTASRKIVRTRLGLVAFFLVLNLSCAPLSSARTLEELKARLDCVSYSDELPWEQVEKPLGGADEAPAPAPGSLFKNARVYRDRIVIFHVDTKEVMEAGRSKFIEVVKTIEVCKEK